MNLKINVALLNPNVFQLDMNISSDLTEVRIFSRNIYQKKLIQGKFKTGKTKNKAFKM